MDQRFSWIGKPVSKVDALDKVLGKAAYAEDLQFPGMLFGKVVRAGVPHALIEEIDVSEARAMEGVACVLTAKDVPGRNLFGIAFQDQEALVERHVRYEGDAVALVAAESDEIARDAARAIHVRYRELPVVTGPHEALADGAPSIHEKGNLVLHSKTRKGDVEAGFRREIGRAHV